MKRLTLFLLFLFIYSVLNAQESALIWEENSLGETFYDLQTWRSMQNRIFQFNDGTIGGVWVQGSDYPEFPDLGILYYYFNGNTWNANISSITGERSTFPSYTKYLNSGEICISQGDIGLFLNWRENKGEGNWNELIFEGPFIHPVVVTTGTNNEIVHLLYLEEDESFTATPAQASRGFIWYARSSDGLSTWDINMEVTELNSDFYLGFTPGSYCWAEPKNDVITFVAGDYLTDLLLMKSTDLGESWQKTKIWEHPYSMFDLFAIQSDSFYCNDGGVSVALDNNSIAHVVFTIGRVYSSLFQNESWYFDNIGGLVYWNEDMQQFSNNVDALNPYGHPESELALDWNLLGWLQDANGSGQIDTLGNYGVYPTSGLLTMPQILIGNSNEKIILFSMLSENYDMGNHNYRHIWARGYSEGIGWSDFVDLNTDLIHIFDECIYPTISPVYNDYFHFVYSIDWKPNLGVTGSQNFFSENSIYHYKEYDEIFNYLYFNVDFRALNPEIYEGDTVYFQHLVSGLPSPSAFEWTFEEGSPQMSNSTNPQIVYNTAGTYNVTLHSSNGSMEETVGKFNYVTVLPFTATSNCKHENFQIYPNPTSDKILVNLQNYNGELQIYNSTGEIIIKMQINKTKLEIDLTNELPGIYFMKIQLENDSFTKKLIIK